MWKRSFCQARKLTTLATSSSQKGLCLNITRYPLDVLIAAPKTKKQLRKLFGFVKYYKKI